MGGFEAGALALVEPMLRYHPENMGILTQSRNPGWGHCLAGSLTGAVASKNVTEVREGSLRLIGNQPQSVKA